MNDRDGIVLKKMIAYILEAQMYISGMNLCDFARDSKTISASAFVLGQLGELARLVSTEMKDAAPHIPWSHIRGLRNRIIHDYENLDMKMFWEVLHDDLPQLEKQLKDLQEQKPQG